MNILYVIISSLGLNLLLILYFLIFGKFSWFQFKAKFMKNPVQINIINSSGKVRSYLLNSSNQHVRCNDGKTRHCDENMKVFITGIANFFYNEDDAEPLALTELALNGINPDYLTQLLLQAEINGANSFIKQLVKINLFIIVLGIIAVLLLVCVWKIIEIDKATTIIMEYIYSMNTTTISA